MLVEKMHVAIDLGLQKVNTFAQKNLLPQEKDFFLNEEVLRFIKQRINPLSNPKRQGVDDTTKRYEDLSDLRKTKEIDVEITPDGNGYIILPDDYYSYVSSKSSIVQLCSTDNFSTDIVNRKICKFPFLFDSNTVLNSYTITLNKSDGVTIELFNIDNLPDNYLSDININKQRFVLKKAINILLPENLSSSSSFYWEVYNNEFFNNNFIIESLDEDDINIEVNINGNRTTYNFESSNYNRYTISSQLWAKNRLMEEEFQDDVSHSYLSNSRPESPVIDLKQNRISVVFPKNVICPKVQLTYFCYPTLIDLYLQRNLNMKDTVSREIISNTVRYLKGVFRGDYETYLNENIMIE